MLESTGSHGRGVERRVPVSSVTDYAHTQFVVFPSVVTHKCCDARQIYVLDLDEFVTFLAVNHVA